MKLIFTLLLLVASSAFARADVSKESSTHATASRKMPREWQVESRLFAADKEVLPSSTEKLSTHHHPPADKQK